MKLHSAFGKVLEEWRAEKFRSVRALFKEKPLSFSYGIYSSFERGESLPDLTQLMEIADSLGLDRRRALLLWNRAQAPQELLPFIDGLLENLKSAPTEQKPRKDFFVPPSSLDNTWSMGPGDVAILLRDPWLWDLCTQLILRFPDEAAFEELFLPKGVSKATLVKKHLKPWLAVGQIVATKTGLRISRPHLYLPGTEKARTVRANNLHRAIDRLVATEPSYRRAIFGNLSESQATRWLARLQALEAEFLEEICVKEGERAPFVYVSAFGPWRIK